jgi:hypothetical protein
VLFNHIARYDAASNFAAARAAKKDSTSMKSIAIMTMVFLPGTVSGCLVCYALPPIVGPGGFFALYWAFALPATAVVFVVQWGLGETFEEEREQGKERREKILRSSVRCCR